MYKVLVSVLFLLLTFPSMVEAKVANKNYSKPFIVRSSDPEFVVRLPSNRTTGFSWFLLSDNKKNVIEAVSAKYQLSKRKMLGAPGVSVWTFNVDKDAFDVPRILHVTMMYARPWDLKNARKKVITVITLQDK